MADLDMTNCRFHKRAQLCDPKTIQIRQRQRRKEGHDNRNENRRRGRSNVNPPGAAPSGTAHRLDQGPAVVTALGKEPAAAARPRAAAARFSFEVGAAEGGAVPRGYRTRT